MFVKAMKRIDDYFSKHTWQNSFYHFVGGLGVGLLLFSYLGNYVYTLAWLLIGIGILGHLIIFVKRK